MLEIEQSQGSAWRRQPEAQTEQCLRGGPLSPGSSAVCKQMGPRARRGWEWGCPLGLRAKQPPRSRSKSCLSQTFLDLYNEMSLSAGPDLCISEE